MKRLRVGVIGLGNVAKIGHLPAYKNVKTIKVVAGAGRRKNVVDRLASDWGFKGYLDFEEMLKKEKLDIACITTGPSVSREITERVAEYGVNLLVEKPLALTLEDARAMIEKCRKEGVKLCYGETFRFFPTCRKAKDMIDEDLIGDISLLLEIFIGGRGTEHFRPKGFYPPGAPGSGGMGLTDHGIHLIDIFRWFTGSEVEWVFGRGNRAGQQTSTEFLTMKFKRGEIGQLIYNEVTYSSDMPYEGIFSWGGSFRSPEVPRWEPNPGNFRVHGTKGALRIFTYPNKMFFFSEGRQEQVRVLDKPHPGHFGLQMESFVQRILNDEEPEVTGIDGLKDLQIILAAYESFETQKIVTLN